MRVSVCVPAFERPVTLKKLISSVNAQRNVEWEICICDDSRMDGVQAMIGSTDRTGIRYRRNRETLGYHENLKATLEMATGDVLVVLGDDDILLSDTALSQYAAVFQSRPSAGFAYANLLQLDEKDEPTLTYDFFSTTTEWEPGAEAIQHLLLRSILITGMAFRASIDPIKFYPTQEMLFPQIVVTREILLRHSGVGISERLAAMRAWNEQLGFKENSKPRTSSGPRHGNIEIMEIIASLRRSGGTGASAVPELERQLTRAYTTNLVNERIYNGRLAVSRNVLELTRRNPAARSSPLLYAVWLAAILLPAGVAAKIKLAIREVAMRRASRRSRCDALVVRS